MRTPHYLSARRHLAFILCALSIFSTLVTTPASLAADESAPAERSIVGIWQGSLKTSGLELRLVFKISKDDAGQYKATLDSPDQGAKGIPIDAVTRESDTIKLESKAIRGTYEGQLSEDGGEIKGTWKQLGPALALNLKRLEKEPDYAKPQEPKKPYPYVAEEVAYENKSAGVKLAGTLTLAKSDRPTPAVLLITGSGAQDRDESLLGHKPFLVLADYLTRQGISVLRVDDRGVGGSTGNPVTSTTDDLAGDVLAGVAYLKSRKEVDPRHIGLVGHSEGGIIAPLAATRSEDIAFIVLLAGTGVTGEAIVCHQGELIVLAQGASAATAALSRVAQERLFQIVKQQPDLAKAEKELREAMTLAASLTPSPPEAKPAIKAQIDAQIKAILSPWFRFFLTYDPAPALRKVHCPVLAINGEKDLQVDPKQNLPPIEAALKDSGNPDVTIKELPGLNHLFQHCKTGSPVEYGSIEETIAPEVLAMIAEWINARAK